jgi:hypothetical protein
MVEGSGACGRLADGRVRRDRRPAAVIAPETDPIQHVDIDLTPHGLRSVERNP